MSAEDPRFNCPACGKSFRWKPEIAGRSAKCACGSKLVVPKDAPAATAPAPPPPIVKAAAPTTNCPICKASVPKDAVLCVKCGYNFKTGKRLAAVVVESDPVEEEPETSAKSSPPADKPPTR
jgi:hypothetical protein